MTRARASSQSFLITSAASDFSFAVASSFATSLEIKSTSFFYSSTFLIISLVSASAIFNLGSSSFNSSLNTATCSEASFNYESPLVYFEIT